MIDNIAARDTRFGARHFVENRADNRTSVPKEGTAKRVVFDMMIRDEGATLTEIKAEILARGLKPIKNDSLGSYREDFRNKDYDVKIVSSRNKRTLPQGESKSGRYQSIYKIMGRWVKGKYETYTDVETFENIIHLTKL